MTVRPLPKAASGAFKQLWKKTLETLDLPRLIVIVEGALDRKTLEDVTRKIFKSQPIRVKQHSREELMGFACERATQNRHEAYFLFRALDRACTKERHIVDSIEDEKIKERLNNYRALSFRRERARLVWALVRDGREQHVAFADALLTQTFNGLVPTNEEAAAEFKAEKAQILATDTAEAEKLLEEVNDFKARVHHQAEVLEREKNARVSAEKERAALMGKIGLLERQLKAEQERRRKSDDELKRFRDEAKELQQKLEQLDPEEFRSVRQERDRFRDRARNLEQRLERAEELASLVDENVALKEEVSALHGRCDALEAQAEEAHEALAQKLEGEKERSASLRKALKTARQLANKPARSDEEVGKKERVGVFVDAENLMASARREHGGRVDFRELLPFLVGERKRVMSVVYVIDSTPPGNEKGSSSFRGFVKTLQSAGFEVREKKLRTYEDGTRKGDWDMGIAMEVLDARHRLDVVVLGSGDGDFIPLYTRLKSWGKRVEVCAFSASTHAGVTRVVDEFVDLSGRFQLTRSGS